MYDATSKYLRDYSEQEITLLTDLPDLDNIGHALAIPCYDESSDFINRILARRFATPQRILVILVVNQPIQTDCPQNQQMLNNLNTWPCLWRNRHISLHQGNNPQLDWLVVDRCGKGIPSKEGVGTARKIAADIVCALRHSKKIASQWLHCSDADTHLPANYFSPIDNHLSAVTFAHRYNDHDQTPAITAATKLYEQALHYYVSGLRWAGSPYGFNTIGSTMAINLICYAQARGFPKRSAAEDFYLLNKLAKLRPIVERSDIVVNIDSRLSHRVPFGTGPAVQKILSLENPLLEYQYYALPCFQLLKAWLTHIPKAISALDASQDPFAGLPAEAVQALHHAGVNRIYRHIRQQKLHGPAAVTAIHHWFDGFRTLKWLRFMQSHYYPAQPLAALYRQAPFVTQSTQSHCMGAL